MKKLPRRQILIGLGSAAVLPLAGMLPGDWRKTLDVERRVAASAPPVPQTAQPETALAPDALEGPQMSEPETQRFAREAERAAPSAQAGDPRAHGYGSLQLVREGTDDSIAARYRIGDEYETRALAELSWFWRDRVDGDQAVWVDPMLFDFVSSVQSTMAEIHGSVLPFVLTSGFRTQAHNRSIEGAARNSLHMGGRAGDFKVPGYPPKALAIAGRVFRGGGVGVYSRFTHLDVGADRCWPRGCEGLVARNG